MKTGCCNGWRGEKRKKLLIITGWHNIFSSIFHTYNDPLVSNAGKIKTRFIIISVGTVWRSHKFITWYFDCSTLLLDEIRTLTKDLSEGHHFKSKIEWNFIETIYIFFCNCFLLQIRTSNIKYSPLPVERTHIRTQWMRNNSV